MHESVEVCSRISLYRELYFIQRKVLLTFLNIFLWFCYLCILNLQFDDGVSRFWFLRDHAVSRVAAVTESSCSVSRCSDRACPLLDAAVHEFGHSVTDPSDVFECCAVHAVFVEAGATHVAQEAGSAGKQHVIGQHHGAIAQQPAVLQGPQVRQVAPLPVVHEHKVQPLDSEILTQAGNHLVRRSHDQLHLQQDRGEGLKVTLPLRV